MHIASSYILEFMKIWKKKAVNAMCEDKGMLNVLIPFFSPL